MKLFGWWEVGPFCGKIDDENILGRRVIGTIGQKARENMALYGCSSELDNQKYGKYPWSAFCANVLNTDELSGSADVTCVAAYSFLVCSLRWQLISSITSFLWSEP